jgi:hypothetical protein
MKKSKISFSLSLTLRRFLRKFVKSPPSQNAITIHSVVVLGIWNDSTYLQKKKKKRAVRQCEKIVENENRLNVLDNTGVF